MVSELVIVPNNRNMVQSKQEKHKVAANSNHLGLNKKLITWYDQWKVLKSIVCLMVPQPLFVGSLSSPLDRLPRTSVSGLRGTWVRDGPGPNWCVGFLGWRIQAFPLRNNTNIWIQCGNFPLPFEKSESLWVRCRARKKTGYLLFKHEVLVPNKTSEANIVPIPPDLQTQKPFFHHLSLISKPSKNLDQHPSAWDNLVGDFPWFLPQNILSRSEFLAPLGPERCTAALHFPGWCSPCHLWNQALSHTYPVKFRGCIQLHLLYNFHGIVSNTQFQESTVLSLQGPSPGSICNLAWTFFAQLVSEASVTAIYDT